MSKPDDFDSFKIPAFLRKRSLASKDKRKLLLTALDRQKAGKMKVKAKKPVLVTALDRKKAGLLKVKKTKIPISQEKPKRKKRIYRRVREEPLIKFDDLLLDDYEEDEEVEKQAVLEEVGVVTHYFDKIDVAVIKLYRYVQKNEEIIIGDQKQIIRSMQINRKNVARAYEGDDIGMKMEFKVEVGDRVFRLMSNE